MNVPHKKFTSAIYIALLCGVCTSLVAASWRTDLYPEDWVPPQNRSDLNFLTSEMVQDFSYAGYHRGERAIPTISGPVFNVVEYGADPTGTEDSTSSIQSAISAAQATGGGVVYMPEGTFRLSKPSNRSFALRISKSNIVLRGAGWDKTYLLNTTTNMRSSRVISVAPSSGSTWAVPVGASTLIAKDYPGPTMKVELESLGTLSVGDWIVLRNPFTDSVQPDGSFVEDVRMDGIAGSNPSWLGDGSSLNGPMMYRQITTIDQTTNTIGIDAPTRWFLLRRDGARVYKVSEMLEEVGLENFSIGNLRHPSTVNMAESDYSNTSKAAYELHSSSLIYVEKLRNSWVRDIRSFNRNNDNGVHMLSNGLVLDWSRGVTVEGVEMQRAQYGGGGGNGYMIRLNSVNEILVKNCRVAYCRVVAG